MKRYNIIAAAFIFALPAMTARAQERSAFIGNLILKDIDTKNGVEFELVEPFGYVDSSGNRWQAEKGLVTDCASIPRALWTVVGSPCTGLYRRAAVIHDFYCRYKYRKWEKVHKVFYDAMRSSGVNAIKSKLMYYAVRRFGPRWSADAIVECIANPAIGKYCAATKREAVVIKSSKTLIEDADARAYENELKKIEETIIVQNPSLDDLEKIADAASPLPRNETESRIEALDLIRAGHMASLDSYEVNRTCEELSQGSTSKGIFGIPLGFDIRVCE